MVVGDGHKDGVAHCDWIAEVTLMDGTRRNGAAIRVIELSLCEIKIIRRQGVAEMDVQLFVCRHHKRSHPVLVELQVFGNRVEGGVNAVESVHPVYFHHDSDAVNRGGIVEMKISGKTPDLCRVETHASAYQGVLVGHPLVVLVIGIWRTTHCDCVDGLRP